MSRLRFTVGRAQSGKIKDGKVASDMDRKQLLPRLCFIVPVALSLLGIVLEVVCMLTCFDTSIGYFDHGTAPTLLYLLYFIAVAASITMAVLIPKGTLAPRFDTPYRTPFSHLLGVCLAAFTILSFITSYSEIFTLAGWMKTILTLLGILASTHFFLSAGRHGQFANPRAHLLGYIPILWAMVALAVIYVDPKVTMNSPVKTALQLGLMGFMLIMLAEMRYRLNAPQPRSALAIVGIGVFFSLMSPLPVFLAGPSVIRDPLYWLCAGVLAVVGLYGAYMLYCCAFHSNTKIPD